MVDVANHPDVRASWPAVSEALLLSASPQVRNMGTMGGNLLQRTRCGYFRDTGFACNKRLPGSGCPAIAGESRGLGLLGVSDRCIATHPSDMPVALLAMDASVRVAIARAEASGLVPLAEFYRLPGTTPEIETNLLPGELITAIIVPASASARRSRYVKVRDRASFEFAVVSAAVALDVSGRHGAGGADRPRRRRPQAVARVRCGGGAARQARHCETISQRRPGWPGRMPRRPRTTRSRSS